MIIERFIPQGGHHCITNSLKQIFAYNTYTISEAMLFGLGSGLNFVYVNLAHSPMISGRIKPLELEKNIKDTSGVTIQVKTPKDNFWAMTTMKKLLINGIPVMIYVDMAYLTYLNLFENSHFGGHSIVVFGFDDIEQCFYVSDRDNNDWSIHTPKGNIAEDFHKVSYDEMEKARSSSFRPFPANNKWLSFDFTKAKPIDQISICNAIELCTHNMLHAPAALLGINGIRKFAKEIKKWKAFNLEKLKTACITNYFMISADGGTGGGAFRRMYGDFLIESSKILINKDLTNSGNNFIEIAQLWDDVGLEMMNIYNTGNDTIIDSLYEMILNIADKEETEFTALQNIIK